MSSNKPFPSSDLDVFKENSLILDNFVNSQENEHPDRFARKRPTITGIIREAFNVRTDISNMNETLIGQSRWDAVPKNTSLSLGGDNGALNKQAQALFNRTEILKTHAREALRRTYLEAGYNLVEGSFEQGGVLNNATDVLLQERTGKAFSGPAGTVAAGTDPTTVGSGYIARDTELLRNEVGAYGTVADIAAGKFQPGRRITVTDRANAVFLIQSGGTADGMGVINAGNGNTAVLSAPSAVYPEYYGALGNGVNNDTPAIQAAHASGRPVYGKAGSIYTLTESVEIFEPFNARYGLAQIKVNHAGIGFHIKSAGLPKKNISQLRDMRFIAGAIHPSAHIKIGEASILEPTNILLDGIHFESTVATTAHIYNERSYGLKINNSAFQYVTGTCIHLRGGIGGDESVYTYNCYINQVDITGCTDGVVVEGGKVQIRDSIIENCSNKAVWSKGISFNPSIYIDNVYFENNLYSIYFESQQPEGYTVNSEIKNSFFQTNSGLIHATFRNRIRLENNKGFKFDNVTGSGTFSLAGTQANLQYNPTVCPTTGIAIESPIKTEFDNVPTGTRVKVPFFNLKKRDLGRTNTALKVTIVRNSDNKTSYYQVILQATDVNGMTWRAIDIAGASGGGIEFKPTFEKNPADATDMNLYFYFNSPAITIVTVEGEGGFG